MATAAVAQQASQPSYSREDETLLVFARLMEGGQEDDETCRDLDGLTTLLNEDQDLGIAAAKEHSHHSSICSVIDVDLVDTMLSYLDLRQPDAVRGRAVLTTSAYLRAAGEQGDENLAIFFRSRVERGTYDDYIVAFCVAAATFPIVPSLTTRLFLAEGFLSSLGPLMRRRWKSRKVETACLEMLNAACMSPECRDAIDTYCSEWLEEVVDQDPAEVVRAAVTHDPSLQIETGGTVSLRRHSEQVLNLAAVILTKLRAVPTTSLQNRHERAEDAAGPSSGAGTASTSVEDLAALFIRVLKSGGGREETEGGSARGDEAQEKKKERHITAERGSEEREYRDTEKKEGQQEEQGQGPGAHEEEDLVSKRYSIEGLAYASLRPSIADDVSRDALLLRRIVRCLAEAPARSAILYGALSIMANLTRYRPTLSEEETKMRQLKLYADAAAAKAAGQTARPEPDLLSSDDSVARRCKLVFEAGIGPAVVAQAKNGSRASLALIVSIVHALSVTPALRGPLAQQGAVNLLISVWTKLGLSDGDRRKGGHGNVGDGSSAHDQAARRIAAQALARILISINPALVLGGNRATPLESAIRPLAELLSPDPVAFGSDSGPRDLLPTFESLMALTNLASIEDHGETGDRIMVLAFPSVEELLLSSNVRIARAATELVCNLNQSSPRSALYAYGAAGAAARLHVLLALADSPDEGTRLAAGGALASLTADEAVVRAVCARDGGIRVLLAMCAGKESEGLRNRGIVTLCGVLGAGGEVGQLARRMAREAGGVETLRECVRLGGPADMVKMAKMELKMLLEGDEGK